MRVWIAGVLGVLVAIASSALGGSAAVATRYLVQFSDPLAVGFLRYAISAAVVALIAGAAPWRRVARRDLLRTLPLGAVMFGIFPWSYAAALSHTTSAVGSIAFCLLPFFTFTLAVLANVERMTSARAIGTLVALAGVAIALGERPAGGSTAAGILYMLGAAFCGAVFTVYSRPLLMRYPPLWIMAIAMVGGALSLTLPVLLSGSISSLQHLDSDAWLVAAYLGVMGSALCYLLWGLALTLTSPTNVAVTITVAPVVAIGLGHALLDEEVGPLMLPGVAVLSLGIYLVNRAPRFPKLAAQTRREREHPTLLHGGPGSSISPPTPTAYSRGFADAAAAVPRQSGT